MYYSSAFSTMATIFHKFSELPSELRSMVWSFALLVPRDVEIHHTISDIDVDSEIKALLAGYVCAEDRYWISKTPCPALLHVNRESRQIGLSSLHLHFRDVREISNLYQSSDKGEGTPVYIKSVATQRLKQGVYINAEVDTVCCHMYSLHDFDDDDWAAIRLLRVVLQRSLDDLWLPHKADRPYLRKVDLYVLHPWCHHIAESLSDRASDSGMDLPPCTVFDLNDEQNPGMMKFRTWMSHIDHQNYTNPAAKIRCLDNDAPKSVTKLDDPPWSDEIWYNMQCDEYKWPASVRP